MIFLFFFMAYQPEPWLAHHFIGGKNVKLVMGTTLLLVWRFMGLGGLPFVMFEGKCCRCKGIPLTCDLSSWSRCDESSSAPSIACHSGDSGSIMAFWLDCVDFFE